MNIVASVYLEINLNKPLDYLVPKELQDQIFIGSYVKVPLRNSSQKGIVTLLKEGSDPHLKPIETVLEKEPLLTEELLKIAFWMAGYYCTPLSKILKLMLPSSVRGKAQAKEQFWISRNKTREEIREFLLKERLKSPSQADILDKMLQVEKGIFMSELLESAGVSSSSLEALIKKEILLKEKIILERSPLKDEEYIPSKPKILNAEQSIAFKQISSHLEQKKYATHLLFGVTGSGKTEIYLQAIQKAIDLGYGAIMLVPEIALTAQTIERFKSRFDKQIAVLHHRLSMGEKHDEWKRIKRGDAKIVIGARSAVFSPVKNLGLIIVDEEHENSYKNSDSMPTYHAREIAIMRTHFSNAVTILGSATPSLESYNNALNGKYFLNPLKTRPAHALLPKIKIIDMRKEYEKKKGFTLFSEELLSGIEQRYKRGEQSLLFLNRRGYHTQLLCQACGKTCKCPDCELPLTFHKSENYLSCHLCQYQQPPSRQCSFCNSQDKMKFRGVGTEQVEAILYAIFPDIRIMRLDADTTKHKGSHQKLYKAFRTGKADLLIGTQMIAKGLHFPEVTLVGILSADAHLNVPDFRASEITFQLLTQVAGRAGRGALPGEVFIQTLLPDHPVIQKAALQDYEAFFQEESETRKFFFYPPFSSLIKLKFSGTDLHKLSHLAQEVHAFLANEFDISSVHAPGHPKIKQEYRLQILIKTPNIALFNKKIIQIPSFRENLTIDINPSSVFY